MRVLILAVLVLLTAGCATVPQDVRLPEGAVSATYKSAVTDPESSLDKTVQWGGVIAAVSNVKDGSVLEIAAYPLDSSGKPKVKDGQSPGRFRAFVKGFLDPMEYSTRRLVTVKGTLQPLEKAKIGEYPYSFPMVSAVGVHLWEKAKVRQNVIVNDPWPYWYNNPYWYSRPIYRPVIVAPAKKSSKN